MKIKVCGLRDADNIKAVAALAPDFIGLICYERSPRFVSNIDATGIDALPDTILKTGVFVNESAENIQLLIDDYGLDAIQLHGKESANFAAAFKNKVVVLKAFGVDAGFDFEQLKDYVGKVDFFLFDTKTAAHGGSGETFDWRMLNSYNLNVPFFLSGGLSIDNLDQIEKIKHPQFYGIDVNSRFETALGVKDIKKLEKAFAIIKKYTKNEIRS
ncbi:phosphoribosylanthranilate isomerase [Mucilaginibacter auburnensis]|uniref:N-(5'-phosphoribosyl)anthranilate isomerase n=1 Tax=Mucilaginibacter auburnensis TaxID=1457233 RepID=A0A2H9VV78_9SPHI|nr:phosphoribosylanthranilate isomerase [Mucilaginibacter auburnensis]PJJ84728.1 phosphoribosylanthranilate isomerase [Mucilaginibacter auburnensis]